MSKKNVGGRPKTEIDIKLFENLCGIQCTKEDICDVLECDEKTLTRWCKETYKLGFSDVFKKKSSAGKISLRRAQFKSALGGNVTMQIWLGKQHLGQRDSFDLSHTGSINIRVGFDDEEDTENITFEDD